MPTALLRQVANSFDRAIVTDGGRAPNTALARQQHEAYRRVLEGGGYTVEIVDADDEHPDCVFIEDTAVIVGSVAVATRPGAMARRGEVETVAAALSRRMPVRHMEAPGTLDGGDVMTLGTRIFVGLSMRTDHDGVRQLRKVASGQGLTVEPIPVTGALHLKSVVLPVDDETVVVTPGTVDESLLSGLRIIHERPDEHLSFSALPLANGDVVVTKSAPGTTEDVADLGLPVFPIDVSEIQAADGGLTCMSILIDD